MIQNLIIPTQGGETDQDAVQKAIAPTQKALDSPLIKFAQSN